MSGICQVVIKQSSGSHQAAIRQSSSSLRQSSGSHQAVIRQLSVGCRAIIWQSYVSHLAVIRQPSGSHPAANKIILGSLAFFVYFLSWCYSLITFFLVCRCLLGNFADNTSIARHTKKQIVIISGKILLTRKMYIFSDRMSRLSLGLSNLKHTLHTYRIL